MTFLFLLLVAVPADTSDHTLAIAAEEAFRAGIEHRATPLVARRDFARAAALYRELHDGGVRSPTLYRNLGHAELHAGRLDQALWAYHTGLRLDPNDGEMRESLEYVRGLVAYPPDGRPTDAWPPFLPRPTTKILSVAAGVTYPVACVLLTWWRLRRVRGPLIGGLLALAVALVSLAGLWVLSARQEASLVLVARPNVVLLRGNGPSYPPHPDVPPLPRGQEAHLLVRRGGWLQVQLPGGAIGWLPADDTLVVE